MVIALILPRAGWGCNFSNGFAEQPGTTGNTVSSKKPTKGDKSRQTPKRTTTGSGVARIKPQSSRQSGLTYLDSP
jgi:hypothetical protein